MNPRPSRDELLVGTAFVWARRSTCDRLHVGALIHREGRILVQGYNGAPPGLPHCNHACDCDHPLRTHRTRRAHYEDCRSAQPCTVSVHAELNAIAFAARWGVQLEGAALVVTHQPCLPCAQAVISAGISSVTYVEPYRRKEGISLLLEAGVLVEEYLDWDEPRILGWEGDEAH